MRTGKAPPLAAKRVHNSTAIYGCCPPQAVLGPSFTTGAAVSRAPISPLPAARGGGEWRDIDVLVHPCQARAYDRLRRKKGRERPSTSPPARDDRFYSVRYVQLFVHTANRLRNSIFSCPLPSWFNHHCVPSQMPSSSHHFDEWLRRRGSPYAKLNRGTTGNCRVRPNTLRVAGGGQIRLLIFCRGLRRMACHDVRGI